MKQNMLGLCIYVHLYLFHHFAAWQLIRCHPTDVIPRNNISVILHLVFCKVKVLLY